MTTIPKIALVIPMLNEAVALPQLLFGIAEQTLVPNEVIFIDSGSTDGSVALVEKWAVESGFVEERFRVITNPGGMPGANRNRGVAVAKSEWIAFIDAGIVPATDWLACLWACADNTRAMAVFGQCYFDANLAFEKAVCALSYGCTATHPVLPASLFKRTVFDEIGLFREDLRAAEDILWVREFERIYGPRIICEDALVYYRYFPSNVRAVIRKWWMYPQHSMRAGIHGLGIWVLPFFLCSLIICLIETPIIGVCLLSTYIIVRGVIDPMRRSHALFWWRNSFFAVLIAVWLGFVMDATKSLSIVFARFRR